MRVYQLLVRSINAALPQAAIQAPTRFIAAPNPQSATQPPIIYEQAYGVANINRPSQFGQYGRRGRRRMAPCCCWIMVIVAVVVVILAAIAIVIPLVLTRGTSDSEMALEIEATKMSVPYFDETDRGAFRYHEESFCSDINTIVDNSQVEASVESCELKEIERYRPPIATEQLNITGTTFTVFVVFTSGETQPEFALNTIIDLLIQGAHDGTYKGYPLPCFSQIDKLYFPGIRDKPIVFRKDYCFNVELTNRTLEHNPKLSVDDPAKFKEYESALCNDVKRLFKLPEVSSSVQVDHCSLNGTESYVEQGLWPPATTFLLWIQIRRIDVINEAALLLRANQLLGKALLYNNIAHRSAFKGITSGQIIKCRRPKPPMTTTPAPTTPPTTDGECEDVEITVPVTEIIGVFRTNLAIETEPGYGGAPTPAEVEEKIKNIAYVKDIFEKCEAELNCYHPPVIYIISLGDPIGQELKFSIKITVVISAKESPSEVAVIVASNDPKGYTRSVKRVTITVSSCDIVSCETYHGGCPHACSTHKCNQLLGDGFTCSCPNDQVAAGDDCVDITDAFPCFFGFGSCLFEITSGQAVNFGGLILPDLESDEELVLTLNVAITQPVCLTIYSYFDTTCPEDNWISLENCWGYRYWNATYGLGTVPEFVEIPKGAINLIFRLRSRGPFIGLVGILATEGPCRRVRLVGGDVAKEGVLEMFAYNAWHPVCHAGEDYRDFLPNLCHHLGFEGKWEVQVPAEQFGERPPSDTYVDRLSCIDGINQCNTEYLITCEPNVVGSCPAGLQALRCAAMAEEPTHQIRYLEGYTHQDGRVEVFYKGGWISLASDRFNSVGRLTAATGGICRTLGYEPAFFYSVEELPGYTFSVLDSSLIEYWEVRPPVTHSIQCLCGAEDLTECRLREVDPFSFFEPLVVWCNPPIIPPIEQQLSKDQITLVGSSGSLTAGRVELEVGGVIGTVCYSERIIAFPEESQAAADVICRTLGHETPGLLVVSQWGFGTREGTAPNFLQDLRCEGDEAHINECTCAFVASSECSHREDAALACGDAAIDRVLNQVTARLFNEKQTGDGVIGLVEVQLNHFNGTSTSWGTVCDDGITYQDVGVICNMLGYTGGGEQVRNVYCSQGSGPINVDNLECPLNAKAMAQCIANPWGVTNCRHHEDLCITCTNEPISVRLERDPPIVSFLESGLVVVRYGGRDGLITSEDISIIGDTTDFLCSKTLGMPIAEVAYSIGVYVSHPEVETEYRARLINNLQCSREDTDITDCQHDGWGSPPSFPTYTLHLYCYRDIPNQEPRIIGPRDGVGNVVVQVGRDNGLLCYKDISRFTDTEAKRICQDLGFRYGKVMMGTRVYKVAVLESADCSGNPTNFSSCDNSESRDNPYCDAKNTAAVHCYDNESSVVSVSMEGGAVTVNINGRSRGAVCKCPNEDGKDVLRHLCGDKKSMLVTTTPQSGEPDSGCKVSLGNVVCFGENCILKSLGVGDGKCSRITAICEDDGTRYDANRDPATTIPPRDDGLPPVSDDITSFGIDCTSGGDCVSENFLYVDGKLIATGIPAYLFLPYTLPYETCACVNVSKADKGSRLIVRASTFSYTDRFLDPPYNNNGESAAIHGEPTMDYEEVCTTVCSFDRPGVKDFGQQRVEIYAIPVSTGTITIADFKLYNGTCESLSMPPVASGTTKCRANNQYVADSSLCDNYPDCLDNSDETNCPAADGFADFEVDLGGWQEVSVDLAKWERWSGPTLSQGTGPAGSFSNTVHPFAFFAFALPEIYSGNLFDSTPGTYLVMQAFRGNPGDQAVLEYNAPANAEQGCLSFRYSLIGEFIAQLRVEIVTSDSNGIGKTVWKFVGASARVFDDPYYQWNVASVNLKADPGSYIVSVHIIAVRGLTASSDISIDHLKINFNSPCVERSCSSMEFQCDDGTCLPLNNQFDQDAQCPDESDLPSTPPVPNNCLPWEFACSDGMCLSPDVQCDSLFDCPSDDDELGCNEVVTGNANDPHNQCDHVRHSDDGSDEDGCDYDPLGETGPRCNDDEYQLWSGECVPWIQRCDGTVQAYDLSDEHNCTCPENSWSAKCGPFCIDDWWICDFVKHCPDDEMPGCEITTTNFLCDNGTLLVIGIWHCDRYPDCEDDSDEPPDCVCGFERFYHECSGLCLPTPFICDGTQNCTDNSDEVNCSGICAEGSCDCNPGNVECADKTKCIPIASWCDGVTDCDDDSDEDICPNYECNPHYQFTCNDGTCIAAGAQNDFAPDCPDGEDEEPAQSYKLCANGAGYYPIHWECDDIVDCDDLSDEAWCRPSRSDEFRCQNGLLTFAGYRCDGWKDCSDSSDELGCPSGFGLCYAFQWRCNHPDYFGAPCIAENNVCNRDYDCRDQTDELRCGKDYQLPADQCELKTSDRCDGVEQCEEHPTNTDETLCLDIDDDGIVKINGMPVCAENWDKYWMFLTCTENGYGWFNASTDLVAIGSSGYGKFYQVPPSMAQPNLTHLANGAQTTFGCASDPRIVKVTCPPTNCGYRSASYGEGQWEATNQITSGQAAMEGQVPWGVAYFYNGRLGCSGSILNQCWVITAGHCVVGRMAAKMEIVIGINKLQGTHYKVARYILHPGYGDGFVGTRIDLALIQLSQCLKFGSNVAPLCLPPPGKQFVGEYCESSGYGAVSATGGLADVYQVMKTGILEDTYCLEDSLVGSVYNVTTSVCVGTQDGWASSCGGDSGGPTYCSSKKNPQQFFLVGATSYGSSACFGVNVDARVTPAVDWIIDQMELYQCTSAEGCDPWSIYSPPAP